LNAINVAMCVLVLYLHTSPITIGLGIGGIAAAVLSVVLHLVRVRTQ
jgi:hypothetical protein